MALKAMRDKNPEVDPFLEEIGNRSKGIPYYAVFRPGVAEPLQFEGVFLSSAQMIEKIQSVVESPPIDSGTPPVALR